MLRLILFLAGSLFLFERLTRKYSSNSFATLDFYVGKKGSGKSTILTAEAMKYVKKGIKVYSSEEIPGCYKFNPKQIGKYSFDPGSVIIIDEISLVFNNRDWQTFDAEKIEWFVLQRHHRNKVIIATQSSSFEKTIRDLVDNIYIVKKIFRIFILARPVNRIVDITNSEGGDAVGGQIIFKFKYSGLPIVYLLPRWTPFFDSFSIPEKKKRIQEKYIEISDMQLDLLTLKGSIKLHLSNIWSAAKKIPSHIGEIRRFVVESVARNFKANK